MEMGDSQVKFAMRRAALYVWVDMIGSTLDLDTAGDEELYLPLAGGRYPLTGRDRADQARHNDFKIREDRSPRFLVLVSGTERISLLVCRISHNYVRYQMAESIKIVELLRLE